MKENKNLAEARGIAWTGIPYYAPISDRKYTLNVTVRDGGRAEAEASLLGLIDIINDVVEPALIAREQDKDITMPDLDDIPEIEFDDEDLGLLTFPPKADDRVPGTTFELEVNEYDRDGTRIRFYRQGNEYPLHSHYAKGIGETTMKELFTDDWEKHFPITEDRTDIAGGELIIRLLVSDSTNKQKKFYVNLVNKRRP